MKKLLIILSPTWIIAFYLKKINRTLAIRRLNLLYFYMSLLGILLLFTLQYFSKQTPFSLIDFYPNSIILYIWLYFLLSSCNEIFYAFLNDAFDKLDEHSKSLITYKERIKLAMRTYFELILNFALIYLIMPSAFWVESPKDVFDGIYYSGLTITTLGYGDIVALHWTIKLLSIYQVFCGMILIVVCFTIYTHKSHKYRK